MPSETETLADPPIPRHVYVLLLAEIEVAGRYVSARSAGAKAIYSLPFLGVCLFLLSSKGRIIFFS